MKTTSTKKVKQEYTESMEDFFIGRFHGLVKSIALGAGLLFSASTSALVLSPDFEAQNIASVGAVGMTVTFDNVYANNGF